MVSATSEIAATSSFQGARAKPARDDQSASRDSFAALVDSNIAADAPQDRSSASSPDAPVPPRRSDDSVKQSDDRARRDDDQSNAAAARDSQDRANAAATNANANQRADSASDDAAAKSDATKVGDDKASAAKDAKASSDSKESKDAKAADAADATKAANADGSSQAVAAVAVAAVAVVIPVPAAPAGVVAPAASDASADVTAPLGIAAAALKAQAAFQEAADAASGEQAGVAGKAVSEAATTTVTEGVSKGETPPAVTADADKTATAAKPVANATTPTDQDIAAAVVAATEGADKSAGKPQTDAPVATTAKTEKRSATATATTAAAASATDGKAAPQSAGVLDEEAKSKAAAGEVTSRDGATSDAAKTATTTATTGAATPAAPPPSLTHDHKPAAHDAQPLAAALDPASLPATAVPQPAQLLQPVAAPAISAAHLTASVATDAAVPLSGLAVEIAGSALNGKSSFQIRLDPAELGRIDVRMDVDRHGQVTSHLTVERPETLAMLRQDAPQLQRALQDAGLKTSDNGLQFSLRDQSSSGQNQDNQSGRNAQRLIISEEDAIPALTAQRSYGRMLGSSGGVDIRI